MTTLAPALLTLLVAVPAFSGTAATYYVSPSGDDAWAGALEQPFATLTRARDAVRGRIARGLDGDVQVLIRGGLYEVSETIVFGPEDSGAGAHTITYAACPGERPVFSAGRLVHGWRKLAKPLPGLSVEAAASVWVANVERGRRFHCLFDGDKRLPRARGDGFVPAPVAEKKPSNTEFRFPPGKLKSWPGLEDVELVVRPEHVYVWNILGLASVDENAGVARTTLPATYAIAPVRGRSSWTGGGASAWVENVPEALDEPGEWMLRSADGLLYLWPESGQPGDSIRFPVLREIIRVEGDEAEGRFVRNLVFRGLTFTHGDRDLWTDADAGLQHDWDMLDKDNALVRFRGAERCRIEHCLFTRSGGGGLRLDLHAQHNRIEASEFSHLGGTGILLCGYGPGTKDVNKHNTVTHNLVHHCGEIYRHSLGIFLWQSGENLVARNEVRDMPYTGILVSGVRPAFFSQPDRRECGRAIRFAEVGGARTHEEILPFLHSRGNLVEGNEVYRTMQVLGDGNGIYISGAGRGNIIRRNSVHDLRGDGTQSAIRIDDIQDGTLVAENIIYDCVRGGITLKHVNRIENNIVARLISPLDGYILLRRGPVDGSSIQRNLLVHFGGKQKLYDERRATSARGWPSAVLADCDADRNLYYFTEDPAAATALLNEKQAEGVDQHSIAADPLFRNARDNDFSPRLSSPAFKLGFVPIDQTKIGLPDDVAPGPAGL